MPLRPPRMTTNLSILGSKFGGKMVRLYLCIATPRRTFLLRQTTSKSGCLQTQKPKAAGYPDLFPLRVTAADGADGTSTKRAKAAKLQPIMHCFQAFIPAAPLGLSRPAVTSHSAFPIHRIRISPRPVRVPQMRFSGGGGPPAPVQERALSILPYLIPMLDSLSFGRYVFNRIPFLANVILFPLFPVYNIYRGIPFLAFGVFLALYVLVVRNTSISRYIRFNVYQALILDIALIFPQLFQGVNLGIPSSVAEVCSTAVFYAINLAIGYAVVTNARGRVPDEIPAVSESVKQQMGPF